MCRRYQSNFSFHAVVSLCQQYSEIISWKVGDNAHFPFVWVVKTEKESLHSRACSWFCELYEALCLCVDVYICALRSGSVHVHVACEASLQACTSLCYVSIFIHMGFFVWTDVWKPTNQSLSCAIITAILINVSHCDPLIFSQC